MWVVMGNKEDTNNGLRIQMIKKIVEQATEIYV